MQTTGWKRLVAWRSPAQPVSDPRRSPNQQPRVVNQSVKPHVATRHGPADPMDRNYPGYPRDDDGCIPEPDCYDILHIWPEHGRSYLWDMTGVAIGVTCVEDSPAAEALDEKFYDWQAFWESRPIREVPDWGHFELVWDSEQQQRDFDIAGEHLARELFDFLAHRKTIVLHRLLSDELVLPADQPL